MIRLPRWLKLRRNNEHAEPYDHWPICPDCWVRFPTQVHLDEHLRAQHGDS